MLIPPSILHAYLADNLDPIEHKKIIGLIEQQPGLVASLWRNRQNEVLLHKLYDTILSDPIPEHLERLIRDFPEDETQG